MFERHTTFFLIWGGLLLLGCEAVTSPPSSKPSGPLYVPSGPVWERGPLNTSQIDVRKGQFEAPRTLRLHAPVEEGTYPLVVFQHGFLSDRRDYDTVLSHVASHGFLVVAAQMYVADGVPLGKPTAADEADEAQRVAEWAVQHAAAVAEVSSDGLPPAFAGHSRGGKVSWLVSQKMKVRALLGLDPVDGRGGPFLSSQPEALPEKLLEGPPSMIVGMEKGGSCAPEGDNYRHFFENTAAPTSLFVILQHGHADMMDDDVSTKGLCFEGLHKALARQTTAGLMTAFLRKQLLGDTTMDVVVSGQEKTPWEILYEAR